MSAEPLESAVSHRPGLRERKKSRTRAEIRAQALRLFREQGFHETTTEQIAAAADISSSTFFRYFGTKERIVLSDDLDTAMVEALNSQPADLPIIEALRRAIELGLAALDREDEQERRELIRSVPELRAAQVEDIRQTIGLLAQAVGARLGRAEDDFEMRVFAGALAGGIMAALGGLDRDPALQHAAVQQAISYLATGFPLSDRQIAQWP